MARRLVQWTDRKQRKRRNDISFLNGGSFSKQPIESDHSQNDQPISAPPRKRHTSSKRNSIPKTVKVSFIRQCHRHKKRHVADCREDPSLHHQLRGQQLMLSSNVRPTDL